MLAVVGSAVSRDYISDMKKRFIIIHHDRPISEILPSKPCVRGFSRAAFRREQIAHIVHSHNRAVKQYRVIAYHLFRYLAIYCQFFKVAV